MISHFKFNKSQILKVCKVGSLMLCFLSNINWNWTIIDCNQLDRDTCMVLSKSFSWLISSGCTNLTELTNRWKTSIIELNQTRNTLLIRTQGYSCKTFRTDPAPEISYGEYSSCLILLWKRREEKYWKGLRWGMGATICKSTLDPKWLNTHSTRPIER